MKLNSKGYMLVEIIVAAVIAFSIAYYLLNLIYNFKDKYDDVYESINLYSAKINVTKNIMNDLVDKTVSNIEVSGSQCESNSSYAKFNVSYIDSSGNSKKETRKLEISRVNNKNQIIYGKVDGNEYDTKDESYYSKEFSSYIEIKCPNNGYFKNSGLVKIPISSIYDNNQYDINLFLFSNNSINLDVNGGSEWTSSTCKNESLNDGINFQDTNKLCNKKIILGSSYGYLPTPLRDGYNFDGWYTEQNGGDKVGESTTVDSYRDSLYAHWNEKKVTIVFLLNNNVQSDVTKEYSYSSTDRSLYPATYSGYEFLNWSWNGKTYLSTNVISNDFIDANAGKTLKFVANWNEKVYQILNGSTEVGYASTLNDAIDSAQTGYTIKLLKDRTDNSKASINGKSLTFDSNGYTLKRDSVISISSNATLTFDGTGTIESSSSDEAIYNEGTLNFKNGTLKASQHAIISSGTAVTNITGGTIYSGNKETIILRSSGTTTITGGVVESGSSWSLGNEGTGTVNISNVNWGGYGPSVYIDGTGKITITNSTITSTSSNALINSGGTMVISNSTIKNEDKYNSTKNTIYVYGNSTTTIDNSSVICYQAAHVIANLGKLNISNSNVYSYSSPKKNGIINANSSAKTVITNVYFLDSIYPSGTTISSKTITSASSVSYKNKKSNSNNFLIFNYNSTNYGMSL